MSRKAWLVLSLLLAALCALGGLCVWSGGVAYRRIRSAVITKTDQQAHLNNETLDTGATLRLVGALPPTLDPALVQDSTSAEYVVHLFSGLVGLDADLNVVPDLAAHWEISPDGRTYTFHLVPEATFQDGQPLTAEDVVYSWERACSPALASPVATSYLDDIVGVGAFARGEVAHIAGLKAVDAHTLRVQIDAPKAYFLAKLTYPVAFVVDRRQIEAEGADWALAPNGSGPFVLERLDRSRIVLKRNERYYGRRPALARVEYLLEPGLPMTMYESDEIDIVGVGPGEIDRVLDPANPLHDQYRLAPGMSVTYLGLNVTQPPFDDLRVRQAVAMAIDRRKLADLVLNHTALPAERILPPNLADDVGPITATLSYDPERARALLASSLYGAANAMPELVLSISGTSGHMPRMTRAILAMLEGNLGLKVRVEQLAWTDFLNDLTRRRFQMYSAGWVADYPDPQNFLDLLFYSSSPQNHTGYVNAEVDRLLERARVEGDRERRMALYRQAESRIVQEAPWVPLVYDVSGVLVKPYVKGYRAGGGLYPWLCDIYIKE